MIIWRIKSSIEIIAQFQEWLYKIGEFVFIKFQLVTPSSKRCLALPMLSWLRLKLSTRLHREFDQLGNKRGFLRETEGVASGWGKAPNGPALIYCSNRKKIKIQFIMVSIGCTSKVKNEDRRVGKGKKIHTFTREKKTHSSSFRFFSIEKGKFLSPSS